MGKFKQLLDYESKLDMPEEVKFLQDHLPDLEYRKDPLKTGVLLSSKELDILV